MAEGGERYGMDATEAVLDRHLEAFGEGDLDELMQDYADDAVFVAEGTTLRGRDEIRGMYEGMLAEFSGSSVSFTLDERTVVDDYAYITWRAETPDNEYEFASNTFVVRDGEIVAQTLAAAISAKH